MDTSDPKPQLDQLPVPADSAACERAPTLIAGEIVGSQGQVKVWSPSRAKLQTRLAGTLAFPFALLLIYLGQPGHFIDASVGIVLYLLLMSPLWVRDLAALCHPAYLTTDAAGIAITGCKGTRALKWCEIQSARKLNPWFLQDGLCLAAPQKVILNLQGYANDDQLLSLIVGRSELQASLETKSLFTRQTLQLPGSKQGED